MLHILLSNKPILTVNHICTLDEIHSVIYQRFNLKITDYYLLQNGKIVNEDKILRNGNVYIVFRTYGGKGGFGSMLRAIGAQIEKTTNREACRDLSGRRLRDINEEKRLKKWITQQTEREEEAVQRKQKKLERLCEIPKHHFKDKDYDNERSQLPEMVETAVIQGMQATSSHNSLKRKTVNGTGKGKKKPKLWIDADDDISSDDSEISDNENDTNSISPHNSESNSTDELTQNVVESETEVHELRSVGEDKIQDNNDQVEAVQDNSNNKKDNTENVECIKVGL